MEYFNFVLMLSVFLQGGFCNSFLSKFHQHEFKSRNFRCDLISYNKDFFNFMEVKTFKYNRSVSVVNVTLNLKRDMSVELDVVVQAFKFLSNEYRRFPARARANWCKVNNANVMGIAEAITNCGNVTGCFFAKETTYHLCNFESDATHLPPNIPNGEYKLEAEGFYGDHSIVIIHIYGEIYRPISYGRH